MQESWNRVAYSLRDVVSSKFVGRLHVFAGGRQTGAHATARPRNQPEKVGKSAHQAFAAAAVIGSEIAVRRNKFLL